MKRSRWVLAIAILFIIVCGSMSFAQENVSKMDIIDADIRDVMRSLGEIGHFNVLMDKTVKGSVTFKLTNDISVKQAIELIAQTYGYSYRWLNNETTVLIGDTKTFQGFENRYTVVYKLNYGSVDQVAEALNVVVPKERIGKDPRVNQITVNGSILEHENIQEIIKKLDREVPQVNIEARVEEMTVGFLQKLGFNTEFRGSSLSADGDTNPMGSINTIKGVDIDVFSFLEALERDSEARLLANPNISTTDNQEGRIFIGDKFPIVTRDITEDGIVYKIEYIEVGTHLTIVPRINSDDVVTVSIKAEVSYITEWKKAGENDVPVISTREARSVVRLKNGSTFVLSGLKYHQSTKTDTRVPYIGKIPVIGWLFRKKTVDPKRDTEVNIFITPRIIRTNPVEKEAPKETVIETPKKEEATVTKTETVETQVATVDETKPTTTQTVTEAEQAPPLPEEPLQVIIEDEPVRTEAAATAEPAVETAPAVPESPAVERSESATSAPREFSYTVKKGETVFAIARKFGVDAKSVLIRNNLSKESVVSAGQTLVIPIPADHIYELKPKETLWRLAKRYGTTVELLMEINGITDVSQVKAGTMIILPTSVSKIVNSQF